MHPSLRVLSSRAHKPLIRFLGKRTYPSTPSPPQAHPAAPAELKSRFAEFVRKFEVSGEKTSTTLASKGVLSEFWEAPERLWKQEIEEAEIDAILSGGASLH
ncbi:hypothetical protein C0991_005560 [Blastosporella zonata]|nr:hypothetical protein C0991_005560 [Blastosporella zonata]